MKSIVFSLVIQMFFLFNVKAQVDPTNNEWIKEDSLFVGQVTNAFKINPANIGSLLDLNAVKFEPLGFGYFEKNGSIGKGYASLFYQVIYFGTKLIGYNIQPQLPTKESLVKRYLNIYSQLFDIDKSNRIQNLYYNKDDLSAPLIAFPSFKSVNQTVKFYMTPFSGTMYGNDAGWGSKLPNRKNYNLIKGFITQDICELLLYSKNPATRFTAIEYFYQNSMNFKQQKKRIEKRINIIFKDFPMIETMAADEVIIQSSKEAVEFYVKNKK